MFVLTGLVARILYAVPLFIFGMNHFVYGKMMAGMVPIPGGIFWVYVTGLALMAAAVAILAKKKAKLASLLLALMLASFALTIHLPGVLNAETMMSSMPNLLKDLSLTGGALLLAGLFAKEEA
jgi:putative oxidoreductase